MLETLVYISSATHGMDDRALSQVLAVSREKNRAADVTGVLLYAGGGFIQVLEGKPFRVDETFKRILCDARHSNITVLYREAVSERNFPNWNMACQKLDQANIPEGLFQLNHGNMAKLDLYKARREVFTLLQVFLKVHSPHLAA